MDTSTRRIVSAGKHRQLSETECVEAFKQTVQEKLFCVQGKFPAVATLNDYYLAVAHAVRDQMLHRWTNTVRTYFEKASRTVAYLSAEFLLGPQLGNNLINLQMDDIVRQAVSELGLSLNGLLEQEEEPGLGNGGLGRLAACYMDSLATLRIPAIGYGVRYEFGIFKQAIRDGWQVEMTDKWLRLGNPWEIPRPEIQFSVFLGGRTESYTDERGRYRVRWIPDRVVKGSPYDTPIIGYAVENANMLRLWRAEACESFDFHAFNVGDYYRAVEQKVVSENITKILYPNDEPAVGKRLRLEQQYFFVSCSLQDMIRIYLQREKTLDNFHRKYAIQLNDTHPALSVAELMRLLVDEHDMDWDKAWDITRQTFAYTNHTLLPEALEKWPIPLFSRLLPRHLEIIFEINRRFLEDVRAQFPDDEGRASRLSLIEETGDKYVRMANLACVGSFAVNGVARLHSDLLKKTVMHDCYAMWPEKFSNKTNGVTPRRFMALANPDLSSLITRSIGEGWLRELDLLRELEPLTKDMGFQEDWQRMKLKNKGILAEFVQRTTGVIIDPMSLFDIQVKRIHEYKRQHLNILHVVTLYNRLKNGLNRGIIPRTVIFGGKAAPGYFMAKLIIKLIHSVADVVNNDLETSEMLKVIFLPDFNVKNAQRIYPAADLSEQISMAGKEASGTGNMKFSLNGALTIGTLDGANLEIREEVGAENFFLFGLTVEEAGRLKAHGYRPWTFYQQNEELKETLDLIESGLTSRGDSDLFVPLVSSLKNSDDYLLLADYASYVDTQKEVAETFMDMNQWTKMSILNVARMGKFSSDRAIREYCEDIWHVSPVEIPGSAPSETR